MKRVSFLILSATILLLAACGKKGGKTGLMVPKDAAIVVHINSPSLSSKLSWDEIRQTNWFKEMSTEAKDSLAQQLLADPASSGVDTKSDLVFYMKKQGKGSIMVFQGSLTDASKFEKLLRELKAKNDISADVKTDGDYSYISSNKDGVILWDKSAFAFVNNADMPDATEFSRFGGGEKHQFAEDSLRLFGKQSLSLSSEDNLDKDSRFADMIKDGADIHIWASAEGYRGDMGPMASLAKINLLFDDNVSATSFNFGNGQINAKTKVFYNSEMTKLLEKYKAAPVKADLVNRIPSGNVAAVMAFNYPPDGLAEFLKVLGVDGMANAALAEMNYSVEEFIKANKGEVLISLSDFGMVSKTDTLGTGPNPYIHTSEKVDMKVLFATAVNDKAAFEKLVTLLWGLTKDKTGNMLPPVTYKLENNWFAASNDADQTNKFLAGSGTAQPFANKITGHPFGLYVDLQKILRATHTSTDSVARAKTEAMINMWQDVIATGGDFSDKAMTYNFEINLTDKNTNSLKQLNQFFDKIYELNKFHKTREDIRIDTPPTVVPAP